MEFKNIKLERLILLKNSEQSERGEVIALAKSIAKHGIMVPITVKRILHTDRYEIISGRKRFYASRLAHLSEIPAVVVDQPSMLGRAIIKRSEKQDLFDEADTVRSVMLYEDMTIEDFSDASGYREKDIATMLLLTRLSELERELVRKNAIDRYVAAEIAKIDDVSRRTDLFNTVIQSRLRLPEVIDLCKKERSKKSLHSENARRTPKFKNMSLFENTLSRAVSILKTSGVKADMESKRIQGGTEYRIRIEN